MGEFSEIKGSFSHGNAIPFEVMVAQVAVDYFVFQIVVDFKGAYIAAESLFYVKNKGAVVAEGTAHIYKEVKAAAFAVADVFLGNGDTHAFPYLI